MHPVLIQEQALPDARYQLQLVLLPVAIDIEGPARLYATQHAYQPFLNLVPGGDPPRYLFLALPRRDQILHRPPQGLGLGLTGLLQSLAHPQHMLAKFRQPHLLRPQVAHHSFRIADRPQGPSKDQPVEATQHSRNLFRMFRDKLLHGVSVPPKIWRSCRTTTSYRERKRLLRLVAALPRCVKSLSFSAHDSGIARLRDDPSKARPITCNQRSPIHDRQRPNPQKRAQRQLVSPRNRPSQLALRPQSQAARALRHSAPPTPEVQRHDKANPHHASQKAPRQQRQERPA